MSLITYMRPTQGHGYRHMCVTQSDISICSTWTDVVDCRRRCSLAMEMEVGNDAAAGPSQQTPNSFSYSKRDVPCAPHLHPHMTHMNSLRTGVRKMCLRIPRVSPCMSQLLLFTWSCDNEIDCHHQLSGSRSSRCNSL